MTYVRSITCVLALLCAVATAVPTPVQPVDKDPSHPTLKWKALLDELPESERVEPLGGEKWREQAREALEESLRLQELNTNVAKNIIIFIGDGMGVTTVTAARILGGGEKHQLSFEKFPYHALSKTYAADFQTTDSAASATAILCGIKNNQATLAVTDEAVQAVCSTEAPNEVESILYKAQKAGKSTGVISNAAITHATPAAAYANSVMRGWESDADMRGFPFTANCSDIARQLIEKGTDINVILGGGRSNFIPREMADPAEPDETGDRRDERDLIGEWESDKAARNSTFQTVYNKTEMFDVDTLNTDYLFGLFSRGHMSYETDKDENHPQPNLAEMTKTALDILQKNDEGYFLLVEGSKIDTAHHASRGGQALIETLMFSEAVETAVNATSEEDTLIIVTADHSHVVAMAGYSARGHHILGKALTPGSDNLPYTTLLYGNGPGFDHEAGPKGRENLWDVNTIDPHYVQQSAAPKGEESHGGEDVSIYASGPMAHLFRGVQESHYIPHAAEYAACIGDDLRHCEH